MSTKTHIKRSKVCYLDFDGVLHSSEVFLSRHLGIHILEPGRALFEWAPILVELLEPHPEVCIVLSTSWVGEWGKEFARGVLPPALQKRVVGATYSAENLRYFDAWPRGRQVTSDAQSRKPDSWFAIDDDNRGWPLGAAGRLVLTDGSKGISSVASQNAIRRALLSL